MSTIQILINNSVSEIKNLPPDIKDDLAQRLSYIDQSITYTIQQYTRKLQYLKRAQHSSNNSPTGLTKEIKRVQKALNFLKYKQIVRLFNKKTNKFPTGLLQLVKLFFNENNINYHHTDLRKKPKKYLFLVNQYKDPPLRYFQEDALKLCVNEHRCTVEAATGTGKTRIFLELIHQLGVRTLIIVPTLNILFQTHSLLARKFGKKYVGIIGDQIKDVNKDIIVASVQSLSNLEPEYFNRFDCLIIDEAHHSAATTYMDLNSKCFNNIYYRYFFSGTVFRNDGSDLALLGVVSTVDYRYSAVQAIRDKFLSPPVFFIKQNRLSSSPVVLKGSQYRKAYATHIVENKQRNQFIADKVKQLASVGKCTLVLVDQIKHGKLIKDLVPNATFISSKSKDNTKVIDRFNEKKISVLIGTDVIGEGVDTIGADALVLAGAGKAKSSIIQKIGRVLRLYANKKYATVIDFADLNVSTFTNHAHKRQKIYKTYETEIINI